jgi:hypothetical protein
MKTGGGKLQRKPATMSLFPSQIPHDLGLDRSHHDGKPATNHLHYGMAYTELTIIEVTHLSDTET